MNVQVKSADGKGFTLPLPNAMLFSPTVLKLLLKSAENISVEAPKIPPETIDRICAAIKDCKRIHGSWELVHVESAEGNTVIITI